MIAGKLGADLAEIVDHVDRTGLRGWVVSGSEAHYKRLPEIEAVEDPSGYDLVVIGTPVWAFTMASPVRTYVRAHRDRLPETALFCTHEGVPGSTLRDMEAETGRKPLAALSLHKREVLSGGPNDKVEGFVAKLTAGA